MQLHQVFERERAICVTLNEIKRGMDIVSGLKTESINLVMLIWPTKSYPLQL